MQSATRVIIKELLIARAHAATDMHLRLNYGIYLKKSIVFI